MLTLLLVAAAAMPQSNDFLDGRRQSDAQRLEPTLSVLDGLDHVAATRIRNRARTLGTNPSARREIYFSVRDRDLAGLRGQELNERLAPQAVLRGSGVRSVATTVDLRRPLHLTSTGNVPVRIGAVAVQSGVRDIQVSSSIYSANVSVRNGSGGSTSLFRQYETIKWIDQRVALTNEAQREIEEARRRIEEERRREEERERRRREEEERRQTEMHDHSGNSNYR